MASTILIPTSPPSNYPVASIVSPLLRRSQSTDSLQCSEQYVTGVSRYASDIGLASTSILWIWISQTLRPLLTAYKSSPSTGEACLDSRKGSRLYNVEWQDGWMILKEMVTAYTRYSPGIGLERPRKTRKQRRRTCTPTKIRTEHFPNINLERYRYIGSVSDVYWSVQTAQILEKNARSVRQR